MKASKDARKLAKQLFQSSFTDGRLDDSKARTLVRSIGEAKPRHYLDVLKVYQRLVRLELEKHHAIIESAIALDPSTSRRVTQDLQNRYGRDLSTSFQINPDLIGGLRVRIGNDVWDGSVRGRLQRLEQEIAA